MTTPSPRILGFSALPLATALLVAPLFVATPTNAGANWLEVRRGGAVRILDAARRAGTPQSWGATYTARVRDKRHAALTNVTIAVARRQLPAAKGKPAVFETTVVIRGLKGGLAGIATSGDTAHVRLPGAAKAVPATGKELFTRLPGLRSPLALFAVLELSHLFDVKLAVTTALDLLGSKGFRWSRDGDLPVWLDPSESALLVRPGREVQIGGVIGRVAVPVLRAFEIDRVVYAFEIDLPRVAPKRSKQLKFQPFSRFPGAERDLAVVVPDTIAAEWAVETAAKAARKAAKDAFRGAAVFDVYRGPGVPPGARSIALRLRFRSNDRTLEDRAVDSAMAQVEKQLTSRDGVVLRG